MTISMMRPAHTRETFFTAFFFFPTTQLFRPPCSHEDISSIFLNSETILFLHQIFYKGLQARMNNWPTLVLGNELFDFESLPVISCSFQIYTQLALPAASSSFTNFPVNHVLHYFPNETARKCSIAEANFYNKIIFRAGDLFDVLLPMLNIYQEYVRNHHFSLQILTECKQNPQFSSVLSRLEEHSACKGRSLETFLTYPMHQIPRYIITLHEILAHTPHEHVERRSLENARVQLEHLSRQMHDEVYKYTTTAKGEREIIDCCANCGQCR